MRLTGLPVHRPRPQYEFRHLHRSWERNIEIKVVEKESGREVWRAQPTSGRGRREGLPQPTGAIHGLDTGLVGYYGVSRWRAGTDADSTKVPHRPVSFVKSCHSLEGSPYFGVVVPFLVVGSHVHKHQTATKRRTSRTCRRETRHRATPTSALGSCHRLA